MADEIKTAESVAVEKFVTPASEKVALVVIDAKVLIRSDVAYERAGLALRTVREKRKALTAYFKEQPNGEAGPGQGLCWYARKAWDAANGLFNKFDSQFKTWDESLDGEMKRYRAEVEAKAKAEAEAKAAEERRRLEAEAAQQRAAAESERKRLETIAEAERKAAEEERQKRLAAEQAAAKSKAEVEAAKRRAEQERLRIEAEAKRQREEAKAEAQRQRAEAEAKEREAQNVVVVVEKEVPKVDGMSVRKSWKAEVVDLSSLVKEVAAGRAPLTCLEASESGCNKLAVAFGGCNPPKGLRFYETEISTTRKTK
jgi:flagellar biosynthesis GTPase FlhF